MLSMEELPPIMAPTVSIPSIFPILSSTWSARAVASAMSASSGMVRVTFTLGISMSGMKMKPLARLPSAVTTRSAAETISTTGLCPSDHLTALR